MQVPGELFDRLPKKTIPEAVRRASRMAQRAHEGQVDKGGAPYVEHCRRVAAKLPSPEAQVVALLHDVLEDTSATEFALREEFGHRVTDAILALTRTEDEAPESYYLRVRANPLAREVKFADIHDNMEPARLAVLDAPTAGRLRAKYAEALVALSSEEH